MLKKKYFIISIIPILLSLLIVVVGNVYINQNIDDNFFQDWREINNYVKFLFFLSILSTVQCLFYKSMIKKIRKEFSQKGLISKDLVKLINFINAVFIMSPLFRFKEIGDNQHNNYLIKNNVSAFNASIYFVLMSVVLLFKFEFLLY